MFLFSTLTKFHFPLPQKSRATVKRAQLQITMRPASLLIAPHVTPHARHAINFIVA
jgi:hypothetical protein